MSSQFRYGAAVLVALAGIHSSLTAQISERQAGVHLTGYGSLTDWKDQGTLVGGGFQFESAANRYLSFYGDLGLATVAGAGCDALVGPLVPRPTGMSWEASSSILCLHPLQSGHTWVPRPVGCDWGTPAG